MLVIYVNSVQVRVLGPEEWRKMVAKLPQRSDEPVEHVSENTAFEELYRKIEVYPKPVVNVVGKGAWDWLRKHFILVEAAGGLVQNEHGSLLLIYRRGWWDLPKGKAEPGETPEETALREITEETGVEGLQLIEQVTMDGWDQPGTYHAYREDGNVMLKLTRWYHMEVPNEPALKPQAIEGIEKARWVSKEALPAYLPDVYASLRPLIEMVI